MLVQIHSQSFLYSTEHSRCARSHGGSKEPNLTKPSCAWEQHCYKSVGQELHCVAQIVRTSELSRLITESTESLSILVCSNQVVIMTCSATNVSGGVCEGTDIPRFPH